MMVVDKIDLKRLRLLQTCTHLVVVGCVTH